MVTYCDISSTRKAGYFTQSQYLTRVADYRESLIHRKADQQEKPIHRKADQQERPIHRKIDTVGSADTIGKADQKES